MRHCPSEHGGKPGIIAAIFDRSWDKTMLMSQEVV
jgi:hypothetical protein